MEGEGLGVSAVLERGMVVGRSVLVVGFFLTMVAKTERPSELLSSHCNNRCCEIVIVSTFCRGGRQDVMTECVTQDTSTNMRKQKDVGCTVSF